MKTLIAALVLSFALPAMSVPAAKKLQVKTVELAGKKIKVEIADDDDSRERGLMFRRSLAPESGMLFVFEDERIRSFWMKNTLIPLSIGYFDAAQRLINVREMEPGVMGMRELPSYPSLRPAKYALEMEKNWFEKNKIKPGAKFSFAK